MSEITPGITPGIASETSPDTLAPHPDGRNAGGASPAAGLVKRRAAGSKARTLRPAYLQMQYDDPAQQRNAATLGMWTFLATEILFFGGLLCAYTVYRTRFPEAFSDGSRHLYLWIGVGNTAVLLTSSFTMALAVRAAQLRQGGRPIAVWIAATIVLGLSFLGIKAVEYALDYRDGTVPLLSFNLWQFSDPRHTFLFLLFYFFLTLLHALHMIIGLVTLTLLGLQALRGRFDAGYHTPVAMVGLYWHFVDMVWIFLLPLLYLIG